MASTESLTNIFKDYDTYFWIPSSTLQLKLMVDAGHIFLQNDTVRAEVLRSCLGAIVSIDAQELRREPHTNHFEADFTNCRLTAGGKGRIAIPSM